MTEERKHAILLGATILLARKLQTTLETEAQDYQIEHYQWRAIHQASRILDKIEPSGQRGGKQPVVSQKE